MPGSNAGNKPNEPNNNYTKMYKHIKKKLNNSETINKNIIKSKIFGNNSEYSNIQKEALYSMALSKAIEDSNRNKSMIKNYGSSLLNNLKASRSGGKKKMGKKKVRKIHKGPRGGKYYISKGKKVYL